MQRRPGGPESDEGVPRPHPRRAQRPVALDHADGEAHQVELARLHDPGVLGHLPTQQGGADLPAPLGHPAHQIGDLGRVHGTGRDVVEEEEGLGTLAHQVVHAHGHQVDADGVEAPGRLRHHRLGADPVRPGHQHRLAVAAGLQGEQAGEPAEVPEHLGPAGGGHQLADPVDGPFAGIGVHAGTGVGGGVGRVGCGTGRDGNDPGHARAPPTAPLRAGLALIWTGTGTG